MSADDIVDPAPHSLRRETYMAMDTKKRNKCVYFILTGVFFATFVFSAVMLVRELMQTKEEKDAFAELSALKAQQMAIPSPQKKTQVQPKPDMPAQNTANSREDNTDEQKRGQKEDAIIEEHIESLPEEESAESVPLPQYLSLYELNQDFFGWITIPDTIIDYPVMFSPDRPNFYLDHNFYGKGAFMGVPYLDEECDPNGSYYLLYGHHLNVGSMFSHIIDYERKSFWEAHQEICFDTLYEQRTYVVAAAFRARVLDRGDSNGFRYYSYKSLDTEEIFEEYAQQVKQMAAYDTGIDLSFGDELLVLSTCFRYTNNGRFVVVAKRVY